MNSTTINRRSFEIDFLRAVAILLMVYTHVAVYFYDFQMTIFNWLSDQGGYLCFTLFLFSFGATLPVLVEKYTARGAALRLRRRIWVFFLVYLGLAFLLSPFNDWISIMTLQIVPPFADYVLAFVLFFGVSWVWVRWGSGLRRSLFFLLLIIISMGGYLVYLAWQPTDMLFITIKSFLVGHQDLHRFPVFQYSIVWGLGILYSNYQAKLLKLNWLSLLSLLLGALYILGSMVTEFSRWAASPAFIVYGLFVLSILLIIFQLIVKFVSIYLQDSINSHSVLISNASSGVMIIHIVILQLIDLVVYDRLPYYMILKLTIIVSFASIGFGGKLKL